MMNARLYIEVLGGFKGENQESGVIHEMGHKDFPGYIDIKSACNH